MFLFISLFSIHLVILFIYKSDGIGKMIQPGVTYEGSFKGGRRTGEGQLK
jgi:hypothetical protein